MLETGTAHAADVDLDAAALALERAFPELAPVGPLAVLGRGFRSTAVVTPGGAAVRIGRSADAAYDYALEWRIGPFVSARLGALVPRPRWYTAACEGLPYGALGYDRLPGETPAWGLDPGDRFALELGAFMARLHALPVAEARAAGVPDVDAWARMLGARGVVMPLLRKRLPRDDASKIDAWWREFADDAAMRTPRVAVCHEDLWHGNLLISPEGALSGVLDIAHITIGDAADDFAAPRYFGAPFMAALLAAYRAAGGEHEPDDARRAQRFWEAREFGGLAWAIEHDDAETANEAIDKIRRGPVLSG